MDIYTIGFTKKTAEEFFGLLNEAGIKRLIDVRLRNSSQLAGFAKRSDLPFFLRAICNAEYKHEKRLAPTRAILDDFKKHGGSWADYERRFMQLMEDREVAERLDPELFKVPSVLLCSEATPEHCHRRLVAEHLSATWEGVSIVHL